MKKAILATKVGMTQIFNEDGVLTPVTVLQAGPCVVTQVKTQDNDGYSAVQVGFADKRENLVRKSNAMFLKLAIRSTLLQSAKVKDSRALSRDTDSPEDLWLTVLNIIVMQVPTVQHQIRVKYSRAKRCRARWEM